MFHRENSLPRRSRADRLPRVYPGEGEQHVAKGPKSIGALDNAQETAQATGRGGNCNRSVPVARFEIYKPCHSDSGPKPEVGNA